MGIFAATAGTASVRACASFTGNGFCLRPIAFFDTLFRKAFSVSVSCSCQSSFPFRLRSVLRGCLIIDTDPSFGPASLQAFLMDLSSLFAAAFMTSDTPSLFRTSHFPTATNIHLACSRWHDNIFIKLNQIIFTKFPSTPHIIKCPVFF